MTTLSLRLDDLVVESFPTEDAPSMARPRTFEPGCTAPELCGGTAE